MDHSVWRYFHNLSSSTAAYKRAHIPFTSRVIHVCPHIATRINDRRPSKSLKPNLFLEKDVIVPHRQMIMADNDIKTKMKTRNLRFPAFKSESDDN